MLTNETEKAEKPGAPKAKRATKTPKARMTFAETMHELEQAGSAQTRKTYARHGATEPMFGVSFATLKTMLKRIGVDHELAVALWNTGNFDARNLAVKIADPAQLSPSDLDHWMHDASSTRMCGDYVAMLAAEGPHAAAKLKEWLAAKDGTARTTGWRLLGHLAQRDQTTPDPWFHSQLEVIEKAIHGAGNSEREAMNMAVILIGCRSADLRQAAIAAAKRIGTVEVDHGDTVCKTPQAEHYIEKTWAYSTAKGFESPAVHERTRESLRLRC